VSIDVTEEAVPDHGAVPGSAVRPDLMADLARDMVAFIVLAPSGADPAVRVIARAGTCARDLVDAQASGLGEVAFEVAPDIPDLVWSRDTDEDQPDMIAPPAYDLAAQVVIPAVYGVDPAAEAARQVMAARDYLAQTDWYVTRATETGQPVPDEVRAQRAAARRLISDVAPRMNDPGGSDHDPQ
jgi:hypothetical protein